MTSRLPWPAHQRVNVTQDCNDSCCNDHVGYNAYAWDFATEGAFAVVAPRAGTVVHVKMSSNRGGPDASEVDTANYIVIDHGDGTYSVMLHLAYNSLDPAVRCGEFVRQGQRLAMTGSTGWSSGNHLHYQLNRIPPGMPEVCECGPQGMDCTQEEPNWDLFWSHGAVSSTLPVSFEEWRSASACADRHDALVLESRNVDAHEPVITLDEAEPGRFLPLRGIWITSAGGLRGTYRQAAPGSEAAAMLSFRGAIPSPGVYEVWWGLPVRGRHVGVSEARAELVARGERAHSVHAQNQPGGGYHPLVGRFKLTGREGEGLVFSASARTAEALAVDGAVLRRVGNVGSTPEGGACIESIECTSDLVCAAGVCRQGCESTGCPEGTRCDATGLCVVDAPSSPPVPAPERAPQPLPRPSPGFGTLWAEGVRAAVRAPSERGGGPPRASAPDQGPRSAPSSARPRRGRDALFFLGGALLFASMGLAGRRERRTRLSRSSSRIDCDR